MSQMRHFIRIWQCSIMEFDGSRAGMNECDVIGNRLAGTFQD